MFDSYVSVNIFACVALLLLCELTMKSQNGCVVLLCVSLVFICTTMCMRFYALILKGFRIELLPVVTRYTVATIWSVLALLYGLYGYAHPSSIQSLGLLMCVPGLMITEMLAYGRGTPGIQMIALLSIVMGSSLMIMEHTKYHLWDVLYILAVVCLLSVALSFTYHKAHELNTTTPNLLYNISPIVFLMTSISSTAAGEWHHLRWSRELTFLLCGLSILGPTVVVTSSKALLEARTPMVYLVCVIVCISLVHTIFRYIEMINVTTKNSVGCFMTVVGVVAYYYTYVNASNDHDHSQAVRYSTLDQDDRDLLDEFDFDEDDDLDV